MPNWCNNKLAVYGEEKDVKRFKEKAAGYSPWREAESENVLNFHNFVPVPNEVTEAGYDKAGYDWECKHWGCKWGACNAEIVEAWEGHLLFVFDTAWSPPIRFLEQLAPQWPTLTFLLDYEEMGVGFKGITKAMGDSVEDHCIEI